MKQNIKNTSITATALRRAGRLTVMACAAMLAGCTADDTLPADGSNDTPVAFTTTIQSVALPAAQSATAPDTRTAIGANGETVWTQGDAVGIIMLPSGQWTPDAILPGGDNVKYTVDPATGKLTPAAGFKPVVYPADGSKVRFVANYPYVAKGSGSLTTNYAYPIDVTDQSDPVSIDLLHAEARNMDKSQPEVALTFRHVLSKIKFDITLGEGLTHLSADDITAVTITGVPATADYYLLKGYCDKLGPATNIATRQEPAPSPGATATFTAIVVPHDIPANTTPYIDRRIIVTVDGVNYTGAISNYDSFLGNGLYVYPVTVRKNGIELGTPTITDWTTSDHGSQMAEFRYTISFDANGGTGTVPSPLLEVRSSEGASLPDASGLTPPDGKVFAGWNTAADYSGTSYKAGDTFIPSKNTTLYAVWEVSSEQVIARFKSYFYEENGQVRANKLPGFLLKDWAVVAERSSRPCEVFADITGMEAPLAGIYDYTYSSADGKCTLKLLGTDHPEEDGIYAVLYVEIEDCPDIGTIYIVTMECFINDDISMSSIPVIL